MHAAETLVLRTFAIVLGPDLFLAWAIYQVWGLLPAITAFVLALLALVLVPHGLHRLGLFTARRGVRDARLAQQTLRALTRPARLVTVVARAVIGRQTNHRPVKAEGQVTARPRRLPWRRGVRGERRARDPGGGDDAGGDDGPDAATAPTAAHRSLARSHVLQHGLPLSFSTRSEVVLRATATRFLP